MTSVCWLCTCDAFKIDRIWAIWPEDTRKLANAFDGAN